MLFLTVHIIFRLAIQLLEVIIMMRMELPGKMERGRTKGRFMDALREDVAVAGVTEDDAEDRTEWRCKICCSDPGREKTK